LPNTKSNIKNRRPDVIPLHTGITVRK